MSQACYVDILLKYPAPCPVQDPYSNLPTIPNFWSDTPGFDMAQAYHQQQQQRNHQAAQAQSYLQSMQEMQMKQQQHQHHHQQQQQRQVHPMDHLEAQFQLQQVGCPLENNPLQIRPEGAFPGSEYIPRSYTAAPTLPFCTL